MGITFSSDIEVVINNHAKKLVSSSSSTNCLGSRLRRVHAENGRLRADLKVLCTQLDQCYAVTGHSKGEVEALPTKFYDLLDAEVHNLNLTYQALSTKVDNCHNNSPPAINWGLAIGLPLGLGIPLTITSTILAVAYGRRR
ncbi:hypothetical protein PDIDSM_200 [Penicillium digitatum]|nr:hypothetical protein PDIDSM_200 [Penicillium digitatum]